MNQAEFKTGVIRPVECYREAWALIKNHFWLLLGVTLVGSVLGGITLYILFGAMVCGIYYCYLRVIDGQSVTFEDLFKGLAFWLPGLLVAIFFIVPIFILLGVIYVPLLVTIVSNPDIKPEELLGIAAASFAVDFIFSILMVCLHTLIMFAFPLIVDKNMSAGAAMKTSARAVWANLRGVAGLFGVGFLVTLLGMLAFCVGTYFVIPLMFGANAVAYRRIFPSTQRFDQPPAPNYYQGR